MKSNSLWNIGLKLRLDQNRAKRKSVNREKRMERVRISFWWNSWNISKKEDNIGSNLRGNTMKEKMKSRKKSNIKKRKLKMSESNSLIETYPSNLKNKGKWVSIHLQELLSKTDSILILPNLTMARNRQQKVMKGSMGQRNKLGRGRWRWDRAQWW